jgi:hypothetical protein
MRMRQARRINVKIDFQGLFRRLKNQVAGRAFCKMLGDFALDRRCQAAFEVIANQSDGFLAIHKRPLTHNGQCSSQAKRPRDGFFYNLLEILYLSGTQKLLKGEGGY